MSSEKLKGGYMPPLVPRVGQRVLHKIFPLLDLIHSVTHDLKPLHAVTVHLKIPFLSEGLSPLCDYSIAPPGPGVKKNFVIKLHKNGICGAAKFVQNVN